MIRKISICLFLIMLTFNQTGRVGAAELLTPSQFIDRSGMDVFLVSFGAGIKSVTSNPRYAKKFKFRAAWEKAASVTVSASVLRAIMIRQIKNTISEKENRRYSEFLSSPLGLRVTEIERQAQRFEIRQLVLKNGMKILQGQSKKRNAMLVDIVTSMKMEETIMALTMNSMLAILKGMKAASLFPGSLTDEKIIQMSQHQGKVIALQTMKDVPASMAYTYSKLSDQELSSYSKFLGTDFGKKITGKIFHVLERTIETAVEEFGRQLVYRLNQKHT